MDINQIEDRIAKKEEQIEKIKYQIGLHIEEYF